MYVTGAWMHRSDYVQDVMSGFMLQANPKYLDFVWKISSRHFQPNMSYIRPESFYLLRPCRQCHECMDEQDAYKEVSGTITWK